MMPIRRCRPTIIEARDPYLADLAGVSHLARWDLSDVEVDPMWHAGLQRALLHNRPIEVMFVHQGNVKAGLAYVMAYHGDRNCYFLRGTGPLQTVMHGGGW